MICAFTSRDAYNGCLTLFSQEEREHRGNVWICIWLYHVYVGYICYKALFEEPKQERTHTSSRTVKPTSTYVDSDSSIFVICVKQIQPDEKISVFRDTRGQEELISTFPNLPLSQVKTVWETQMDFTSAVFVVKWIKNRLISFINLIIQILAQICSK